MLPIIISAIECPEDRDLMTDFYLKHKALLFHEAKKHLSIPEDIEDTVFEALTRIIDKIEVFRELKPWQQVAYAQTTVRNLSYILLRRSNHFTFISFSSMEFDLPAAEETFPDVIAEKSMHDAAIRKIWNALELEDKILLEQKYILRWRDEEIALPLNIKPQSVRMRLTRAKRNLVAELQKNGFDISEWL